MLSPEGAKMLSLAVLSTRECFSRLGETVLYTPVPESRAAEGHGTECKGLGGYPVTCQFHSFTPSVSPEEVWMIIISTSLSRKRRF